MDLLGIITIFIFFGAVLITPLILPFVVLAIGGFIACIYVDIKAKKFQLSKWFLLISLVLSILSFIFIISLTFLTRSEPKEDLIQNYTLHKSEFNQLVRKIQIDQKKGLERIDNDWTRPENYSAIGLTEKDIENYRKEYKDLHVSRGFYAYPDKVNFVSYAFGLAVSGSSQGYLYSVTPPKNYFEINCGYSIEPLKDLSEYKGCDGYGSSHIIYQKIDNSWYIYSQAN